MFSNINLGDGLYVSQVNCPNYFSLGLLIRQSRVQAWFRLTVLQLNYSHSALPSAPVDTDELKLVFPDYVLVAMLCVKKCMATSFSKLVPMQS